MGEFLSFPGPDGHRDLHTTLPRREVRVHDLPGLTWSADRMTRMSRRRGAWRAIGAGGAADEAGTGPAWTDRMMRHGPYLESARWFSVGLGLLMALVPLACGGTKALESGPAGAAGSNAGSMGGAGGGTGGAAGSNAGSVAGSGGGTGGAAGSNAGPIAGAGGMTTSSPDAGSPDAGADVNPACSPEQSVAPVPGVAVYQKNTCVGSASKLVCSIPDLMPRLLACDAVSFMFKPEFSLSSSVFRVAERRQDTCVIELWEDYEANESYWICELPLPLVSWKGLLNEHWGTSTRGEVLLDGIKDHCKLATCCMFTELCGPAHCDPGYRFFGC